MRVTGTVQFTCPDCKESQEKAVDDVDLLALTRAELACKPCQEAYPEYPGTPSKTPWDS